MPQHSIHFLIRPSVIAMVRGERGGPYRPSKLVDVNPTKWPRSLSIKGAFVDRFGATTTVDLIVYRAGMHHSKPYYYMGDTTKIFLYFWDERDGPEWWGWWLAPTLGGNDFWIQPSTD